MIGGSDDHDSTVVLQAVNLVEKIATQFLCDECVDVLEDEEARGLLTGFLEYFAHLEIVFHGLDVEGNDRFAFAVDERMHDCFQGDGFAIPGWAMEDEAAFPGN